jgi:hypothetical protein
MEGYAMKLGFAVTLFLIAAAGMAQANCSTANLAGTWTSFNGSGLCTATISSAGVVTGTCGSGTVAMTSACKFSGTIGGKSLTGRSEAIAAASALKPNLLVGSTSANTPLVAYRK